MIGIVVVNFGDPEDTIDLIKCFVESRSNEKFKMIIVDNYSTENNLYKLKNFIEDIMQENIILIPSKENTGFSGGNNIGIDLLRKDVGIEYLWLLNNDTLLLNNTLDCVASSVKEHPKSIIGGTIVYHDSDLVQCLGGSKFNRFLLSGRHIGQNLKLLDVQSLDECKISCEIDYISGACMIFPIDLLKEHLLDQRYFLYYEEIDISMRFKKKVDFRWCKEIIILHKEGRSINGVSYTAGKSDIAEFNTVRSSILFARKWYPRIWVVYVFIRMSTKIFSNIRRGSFNLLKIDFMAMKDALGYNDG